MSKVEESIDDMEKFNEKIYEDGITWLFGHHCLECGHLTFAQHEVKEFAKYFYELGYHQAEKDLELGSEDIRTILNIENDILSECNSHKELVIETYPKGEDYYGEILKRFKERK